MYRSRPHTPGRGPRPAPSRLSLLAPALCWGALLVSCAAATEPGGPAAEDTTTGEPSQELTATVEDADTPAARPVSVDLPGLPIGGDNVTFSSSTPAVCVDVNWTAGTLVDGVSVAIRRFGVPEAFSVSSDPCSATPCLGSRLTTSSPGCQVVVVWHGGDVDPARSELTVPEAALTCVDVSRCEAALAQIEAEGTAAIGLRVDGHEPASPSETTAAPDDGSTPPDDGSTPPDEEPVTPGEGSG